MFLWNRFKVLKPSNKYPRIKFKVCYFDNTYFPGIRMLGAYKVIEITLNYGRVNFERQRQIIRYKAISGFLGCMRMWKSFPGFMYFLKTKMCDTGVIRNLNRNHNIIIRNRPERSMNCNFCRAKRSRLTCVK